MSYIHNPNTVQIVGASIIDFQHLSKEFSVRLLKMALQPMETLSSNIVPQKTLNDIDSMYYYLNQRLEAAKQITDLIPFIQKLMNIDELKQHLKLSLDKQYQSVTSKSDNNIRSLFISLFSLDGIPSDPIHAHILSFLPSIEYRKIPLLSRHFRCILKNNPYIYNEKSYNVTLQFSIKNDELEEENKRENTTKILMQHKPVYHAPVGVEFVSVKPESDSASNKDLIPNDINKSTIPIFQLKQWMITHQRVGLRLRLSRRNSFINLADSHNRYMVELCTKQASKIEKLTLFRVSDDQCMNSIISTTNKFDSCVALSIIDCNKIRNISDTFSFTKLQCLEVSIERYGGADIGIDHLNQIITLAGDTLKCLRYKNEKSDSGGIDDLLVRKSDGGLKIFISGNMEFCCIDVAKSDIKVDLSKCEQLIAMKLVGICQDNVKWPENQDVNIPFACIGEFEGFTSWNDVIQNKKLSIHLLSYWRRKVKHTTGMRSLRFMMEKNEWVHDKYSQFERISNIAMEKSLQDKNCLVLDKEALDRYSSDGRLIYDIMENLVKEDIQRANVMESLRRWWYLSSADWIKDIGFISKKE